jgi:uridylate kinase
MGSVTVVSLGGSLIAPAGVDRAFLKSFAVLVAEHLEADAGRKLILVCGGGSLARDYQAAYRDIAGSADNEDLDWVGIAATRVNGELVRRLFKKWCGEDLVTDPTSVSVFAGRVMVAAGWKPGFSSDYDAVVLARSFSAGTLVNLSNVSQVYSADPRTNPDARPVTRLSWEQYRGIVGGEWVPGKNAPFDPIAARLAAESRIRVIVAAGADMANTAAILAGRAFTGSTIGPD